jgi:hypothetical protein
MNTALKEKIDNLDPWFDALVDNEEVTIHAVEYHSLWGTVVIWSDEKGYSYSHKSGNFSAGVSGAYESLIKCVKMID